MGHPQPATTGRRRVDRRKDRCHRRHGEQRCRHQRRVSLPFAPLEQTIAGHNQRARDSLRGRLGGQGGALYRAYHRGRQGRVLTLRAAEDLCDAYGWHPRQVWGEVYDWAVDLAAAWSSS